MWKPGTDSVAEHERDTVLLQASYPLLVVVARQYVHSADDADDVVQEAVSRFWKYGRQQAENGKAYLISCVRHASLDYLKDRQRRKQEELAVGQGLDARCAGSPTGSLFESSLELEEWRKAVERALEQIPLEQREVLVLKIWGECTFPQIGEALGISLNTAASRYRYGLLALRKLLGESYC
jgi:RNA polymerase sigma factor (sigma-70 family)